MRLCAGQARRSRSPTASSSSMPSWSFSPWASCIRCTRACSMQLQLETRPATSRSRSSVEATEFGNPKVFAAGDMRHSQSLVVWAVTESHQAAHAVDRVPDGRRRRCRSSGNCSPDGARRSPGLPLAAQHGLRAGVYAPARLLAAPFALMQPLPDPRPRPAGAAPGAGETPASVRSAGSWRTAASAQAAPAVVAASRTHPATIRPVSCEKKMSPGLLGVVARQ